LDLRVIVYEFVKDELTIAEHSQANEKHKKEDFYVFYRLRHDLDIDSSTTENSKPEV